jgi:hypothetical protein
MFCVPSTCNKSYSSPFTLDPIVCLSSLNDSPFYLEWLPAVPQWWWPPNLMKWWYLCTKLHSVTAETILMFTLFCGLLFLMMLPVQNLSVASHNFVLPLCWHKHRYSICFDHSFCTACESPLFLWSATILYCLWVTVAPVKCHNTVLLVSHRCSCEVPQ